MGRSEMEGRCKRHPEHRQSRGVCPFCLRDRLSHISATSSTTTTNASSTSSYSSGYSSANSPPHQDTKTTRLSLPPKGNPGKSEPLKKSRSVAFVIREHKEEDKGKQKEEERKEKVEKEKEKKKKNKGWFWSKLMIGSDWRKKQVDGSLSHSKTMKEKSSAKWVLF